MKMLCGLRRLAAIWLVLAFGHLQARAQGVVTGLIPALRSSPTNGVLVNRTLTYTLDITNASFGTLFQEILVTNPLPSSVQFLGASATRANSAIIVTNATEIVFDLFQLPVADYFEVTLTVQPTVAGLLTNTATIYVPELAAQTNISVVNLVTNAPQTGVDLAVGITGPAQPVIVNDLTSYQVAVSNLGSNSASGVVLTNGIPLGVRFLGSVPSFGSSNFIFNLGTLAAGAVTNVTLRIQPTNSGAYPLIASVGAQGVTEANTTNNTTATLMSVSGYLSTNLVASLVSTQQLNRQVTLMEQTVQLSNIGTTPVASARVVVSGLTNVLYNAVGTNGSNPFVVHAFSLAAGQSVNLLLQFAPNRTPFPLTNSQLQAYGVPAYNVSAPSNPGTPVTVVSTNIVRLPSGNMLVQFQSTSNRTYTVVYSDNPSFSNALLALPPVRAQANWVQWMDYGPPETMSAPGTTSTRFYRVFANP